MLQEVGTFGLIASFSYIAVNNSHQTIHTYIHSLADDYTYPHVHNKMYSPKTYASIIPGRNDNSPRRQENKIDCSIATSAPNKIVAKKRAV
jgi:hypothetical protein